MFGMVHDMQEMIALMRSAVEQGVTFFDTAEVNAAGRNPAAPSLVNVS